MSACEECWTEANWRWLTKGGSVVDHYHEVLAENEAEHTEAARIEAEKKLTAAREPEPAREVRDPAEVVASHLTEENA